MDMLKPNTTDQSFKYFDLYGSMRSHKVMLEDMARMKAYHAALFQNKADLIKDKVVLDVGCGTGVLSVWAAKAGARRVYAVEASQAVLLAQRLVASANVADVVKIFHNKIEAIDLPEPVDVIVSEWMGSLLLKESMFDSVAYARDQWLKPDGIMMPSHARILLGLYAPTHAYDHTQFVRSGLEKELADWSETVVNLQKLDVDYSCFTDELRTDLADYFIRNAIRVNYLSAENLPADAQVILEFDCGSVDPATLTEFSANFQFMIQKQAEIKGFLGWFTTDFPNGVVLDTGPGPVYTHWGQQLYPLEQGFTVTPGDQVIGQVRFRRHGHEPRLNIIEFKYQVGLIHQQTVTFNMGAMEHMHEGSKSVLFSNPL